MVGRFGVTNHLYTGVGRRFSHAVRPRCSVARTSVCIPPPPIIYLVYIIYVYYKYRLGWHWLATTLQNTPLT